MNYDLTNPREIRGLEIARRFTIRELNGFWLVPSVSGKGINGGTTNYEDRKGLWLKAKEVLEIKDEVK